MLTSAMKMCSRFLSCGQRDDTSMNAFAALELFLLASLLFLGVVVVGWVVCSSNDLIEEDMERVVKENERVKENEENKNCDERRMENGVHESKVGSVVELQIPMVR